MKKLNIFLSIIVALVLMLSEVPAAKAEGLSPTLPNNNMQVVFLRPKVPQEVWVMILNTSNRYVTLYLDHKKLERQYSLVVAPGETSYILMSGDYRYSMFVCGKYKSGGVNFKWGKKWKIGCLPNKK